MIQWFYLLLSRQLPSGKTGQTPPCRVRVPTDRVLKGLGFMGLGFMGLGFMGLWV